MTAPNGVPGHNAVFEEKKRADGHEERKVLIGEIHINEFGYESPLLFVGSSPDDLSDVLDDNAVRFFGGHIESRFIYQLADFMRDTEKRMVQSDIGHKLVE